MTTTSLPLIPPRGVRTRRQAGRRRHDGFQIAIVNSGFGGARPGKGDGELSHASVYVSLLPVVEACVVVVVPGHVGEVRVTADEPEAIDLDPGVLSRAVLMPQ